MDIIRAQELTRDTHESFHNQVSGVQAAECSLGHCPVLYQWVRVQQVPWFSLSRPYSASSCVCVHACLCVCARACVCLCVCMHARGSLSLSSPHPHLSLGVATRDVQVCNQPAKCTCCSWRELLTGLQSLRITLDAASSTTPNSASKTERRSKALWSSLYAPVGFCGRGNRTQDSSVMERTGQQIV